MKKITYLTFILFYFIAYICYAQTVVWSSDLEDLTGWSIADLDMDGNDWGVYAGGGESVGFSSGAIAFSRSWDSEPAPGGTILTPDNILYTPTFDIPAEALTITFKMKVGSASPTYFAEKYAVLVYDDADFAGTIVSVYEERLTEGGDNTAKDISVSIPASFAGKTTGIGIRHYDTSDEYEIYADDFEVSYTTSLSTQEKTLEIVKAFPNPVKDILTIKTPEAIDNIAVINQLGQKVLVLDKNNIFNNSVDLSALSKGLYIIQVQANNKSNTITILKK